MCATGMFKTHTNYAGKCSAVRHQTRPSVFMSQGLASKSVVQSVSTMRCSHALSSGHLRFVFVARNTRIRVKIRRKLNTALISVKSHNFARYSGYLVKRMHKFRKIQNSFAEGNCFIWKFCFACVVFCDFTPHCL